MKIKLIRCSTISLTLSSFVETSIKHLMSRYDLVLLSSPDQNLEKLGLKFNIKTIGVLMQRRMSPVQDLRSLLNLIKVFHKEKPYMVHSMTPKAGLLCMLAAWITRVPRRVHTFTGLVWPTATGLSRKILMATDWLTCACATHIIPEGKGVMKDLQHISHKPMKVLGFGNVRGVDLDYWRKTNASSNRLREIKRDDVFTFIFVGRIVRD